MEKASKRAEELGLNDDTLLADKRINELCALVVTDNGNPLTVLIALALAFDLGSKPVPEEFLPDVKLPKSLFDECPADIPAAER